MNKKGFTLSEMLITVAILGFIILIVTPNITGILKKVDDEKYQRFLSDVFLATEAYIQNNIEEFPEISNENEKVYVYFEQLINAHYLKSDVYDPKNKATVKDEDFTVEVYLNSDDEYSYKLYEKHFIPVEIGQAVYLDPTNLSATCDESNSVSAPGTKTGCMKWYVIKDNGNSIDVLLDHNTTATVAWNSSGSNASMGEVATALSTDTTGWTNGLNPRLIAANEIETITGNTSFDGSGSTWFYFGSNNSTDYLSQTEEQKARQRSFAWLFDYTSNCTSYGCNIADSSTYGYWTSSPVSDYSSSAWYVYNVGSLSYNGVAYYHLFGIRPVITVPKSLFN